MEQPGIKGRPLTWKARLSVLCLLLLVTPFRAQTEPFSFILLTDAQFGMHSGNKAAGRDPGGRRTAGAHSIKEAAVLVR